MPRENLPAAGVVRATVLEGALRQRVVGLAEGLQGPCWFALLLENGQAQFSEEDSAVSAPALVWRPWPTSAKVVFAAGTVGTYILMGTTALASAVGHMPESRDLRLMADQPVTIPLAGRDITFRAVRPLFFGVHHEIQLGTSAAHAVVEAYLRVVLIEVYRANLERLVGSERVSASRRLFTSYIALVERQFRDRWGVAEYARKLGISRDRLGDVCRRMRGVGPKELIDRRVTLEARLQLENSSNSIQQISGLLGFATAAQFNKFFHRTTGHPPGRYRVLVQRNRSSVRDEPVMHYDWP